MAHQTVYRPDYREPAPPAASPRPAAKLPSSSVRAGGFSARAFPGKRLSRADSSQRLNRHGDSWTAALNVVVIALAALLGWMVGRAGWKSAAEPQFKTPAIASSRVTADAAQQNVLPNDVPAHPAPRPGAMKRPVKHETEGVPPGALVVYKGARIVFEAAPANSAKLVDASADHAPKIEISSSVPDRYVEFRVDPQYPESARAPGVHGRVVLDLIIDADGRVKTVMPVSGNSMLASAATDALRQWRFTPVTGGQQAFQARVIVNFRIPQSQ